MTTSASATCQSIPFARRPFASPFDHHAIPRSGSCEDAIVRPLCARKDGGRRPVPELKKQ
jgi:hypothetical protein